MLLPIILVALIFFVIGYKIGCVDIDTTDKKQYGYTKQQIIAISKRNAHKNLYNKYSVERGSSYSKGDKRGTKRGYTDNYPFGQKMSEIEAYYLLRRAMKKAKSYARRTNQFIIADAFDDLLREYNHEYPHRYLHNLYPRRLKITKKNQHGR